jgi:hypothetical protein
VAAQLTQRLIFGCRVVFYVFFDVH